MSIIKLDSAAADIILHPSNPFTLFLQVGAGYSSGVGSMSLTAGAPNQLGMAPGTAGSMHLPSSMEKYLSLHSKPGRGYIDDYSIDI